MSSIGAIGVVRAKGTIGTISAIGAIGAIGTICAIDAIGATGVIDRCYRSVLSTIFMLLVLSMPITISISAKECLVVALLVLT